MPGKTNNSNSLDMLVKIKRHITSKLSKSNEKQTIRGKKVIKKTLSGKGTHRKYDEDRVQNTRGIYSPN